MENDLISKKDLLAETGISYGQLYRWKRKGLIPEDWFIHRAAFTGQETFFPRAAVLARIGQIQQLKDDVSLNDLVAVFSPTPAETAVPEGEALARGLVSAHVLPLLREHLGEAPVLGFHALLYGAILDRQFRAGEIGREEGVLVLHTLAARYPAWQDRACDLLLLRKLGVSVCLLVADGGEVAADADTRLVVRVALAEAVEALKLKLTEGVTHGSGGE
jgi:hypothetical protein